ncbi:aspartate carbamoyltransferase catalytic subunit [Thermosediminibacter litoriperuensis]|uniref:Aspartate carbamoyltransferase n=1 Tax=Thermosediminibacter litoriperuensis TaxID=291989 RepID=A0A5S5AM52_9FIRM|nr:aspartate carbamoyltransferase catalytic subunit [Thermosediminibacter litoriperuensis]TYP52477.1 aspartate carbamoyltransferase [Thermosediminibacter litoriperuensis]
MFKHRHLLGLGKLTAEDIAYILRLTASFKEIIDRDVKKFPTLKGKAVVNLFYEASTRTRNSFELAAKYLSADTISFASSGSSVEKGETLKDTAKTLEMMGVDAIVIRHGSSGAAEFLSRHVRVPVINAGDGTHEHPTQALLDMFTVMEKKGTLSGLKVAIVGDILHSRVARSNIFGFTKMGAEVYVAGPATLMPPDVEKTGARLAGTVDEAVKDADVVMALRIQLERQKKGMFPTAKEYSGFFGINGERLKLAKPDALLLHPGPVNRGLELCSEVVDGLQSLINEQVRNGVAVRMAVLYILIGGGRK